MNLVNAKTALEQIYDIERLVLMKAWNVEIKDLRNGNMIAGTLLVDCEMRYRIPENRGSKIEGHSSSHSDSS